jgi:hypothetical protein
VESYKKNGKKGKKMKIKSDYLHFITCGTFIWIINSWSAEDVSVYTIVLPSPKVTLLGKFKQLYVILVIPLLLSFVKFPLLSQVYSFAALALLLKGKSLPFD